MSKKVTPVKLSRSAVGSSSFLINRTRTASKQRRTPKKRIQPRHSQDVIPGTPKSMLGKARITRGGNFSADHVKLLLSEIQEHPVVINAFTSGPDGRKKYNKAWRDITEKVSCFNIFYNCQ